MHRTLPVGRLRTIAFSATVLLSLPLVAGFFGSLHPAFDSMAHFRVHLAVSLIVCALALLGRSLRLQGLAAIAFGIAAIATVYGSQLIPGLGPVHAGFQSKDVETPVYRLLQLNLRFNNAEPGKVLSLIGRLRPDVITLQEVSTMWTRKLDLLASAYPYRTFCDMPGVIGGVAILSLRPLSDGNCFNGGTYGVASIDFGGRRVGIGAIHLPWPWPFDQSGHIDELKQPLGEFAETAILAGDLNATPWSAAAARIAAAAGLTPVATFGPTWQHHRLPEFLRFAGLPIDQAFAKGDVVVHSAVTLDAVGSDHLPVLLEFSLKATDPAADAQTATVSLATRAAPRG